MIKRKVFSKKIIIISLLILISVFFIVLWKESNSNTISSVSLENPLMQGESTVGVYKVLSTEEVYDSLAEAVNNATNDDTITLLTDVSDLLYAKIDKKITLDLENCTLMRCIQDENGHYSNSAKIEIVDGGNLTITGNGAIIAGDSHETTLDSIYVTEGGILNFENGALYSYGNQAITCYSSNSSKKAIANIEGGKISGQYAVVAGNNSIINIYGGELSGSSSQNNYHCGAGVGIFGGTVNVGDSSTPVSYDSPVIKGVFYDTYNDNDIGSWNFYNGIINCYETKDYPKDYITFNTNPGQVRDGYKIKTDTKNNRRTVAYLVTKTESEVTLGLTNTRGNVIEKNSSDVATVVGENYGNIQIVSSNPQIATATIEDKILKVNGINAGTATINLISSNDTNKTVQFEITVDEAIYTLTEKDGKVSYFRELSYAASYATNGSEIKLLTDATDTSEPQFYNNLTLDTNGKTLNRENSKMIVNYEGALTIKGNGTISQKGNGKIIVEEGTSLNIQNGKIEGTISNEGGTVNIGDSLDEFSITNPELSTITNTNGGKWNFYNGIFKSETNTYDIAPNEVREGYKITTVDGENNTKETYLIDENEKPTITTIEIPTAVEGLIYNDEKQTGVLEGEGYTLTGNNATEAGEHTAIATLIDKEKTQWSDNTTEDKEIKWNIEEREIEIKEEYAFVKNMITEIQPNTKNENFKKKINSTKEFDLYQEEEKINDDAILKTGQILKVGNQEYTIVVSGDVDGDGISNIRDILKINKCRLKRAEIEGAEFLAGDINKDKKIDIMDILKINKFRLGKINKF